MKTFILHGEMADLFCQKIDLKVESIREAIHALSAIFPDFKSYFIKKTLSGVDFIFVNQQEIEYDISCSDINLKNGTYSIIAKPQGAAGADFAAMGKGFAQNFALSYGMQMIAEAMRVEDGPPEYEIIETNSFIYSSNDNRVEQGTTVPVIYGQLRVGSKIINSSVDNYDYDFDQGIIYDVPEQKVEMKNVKSYKHTFVQPKNLQRGYNVGAGKNSDPSKRILTFQNGSIGAAKAFSAKFGNAAPLDLNKKASSNGGDVVYSGPSVGAANVASSSSTTVNGSPGVRPYVFPPAGSLDSYLRPSSSSQLCVEKVSEANAAPSRRISLGYITKNTPMTVGNRGSYQKLESLSVYKSLEIISEGPIAGLATPVDTLDYDNAEFQYPVGQSASAAVSPKTAELGTAKFIESISHLGNADGGTDLEVVQGGKDYSDSNGNSLNGTFTIKADGEDDPTTQISIRSTKPQSMSNASVDAVSFPEKQEENSDEYNINAATMSYWSSNKIFLLKISNGEITPNTIVDPNARERLDSKYYTTENRDINNAVVFNLETLAADAEKLQKSFSAGNGYKKQDIETSISPYNGLPDLSVTVSKNSAFDRISQAEALDMATLLASKSVAGTSLMDGLIADFLNSSSTTLPNSDTGWDKICRIQIDKGSSINLNASAQIQIGTARRDSDNELFPMYITVTAEEYIAGLKKRYTITTSGDERYIYESGVAESGTISSNNTSWEGSLGRLIAASKTISDRLYNAFSSTIGAGSFITFGSSSSQRKHIKFVPGSGNTRNCRQKIGSSNMPYAMAEGGYNTLNNVSFSNRGHNVKDEDPIVADRKGFYSPLLFPRVTVFVLRKSSMGVGGSFIYNYLPTEIEAVASVNKNGVIEQLHLLSCPDFPVFDSMAGKSGSGGAYTAIHPQDINGLSIPFAYEGGLGNYQYQDIGFFLKIDPSNSSQDISFEVKQDGKISDSIITDSNKNHQLAKIYSSWRDFLRNINPSTTSANAAGIVPRSVNSYTAPSVAKFVDHLTVQASSTTFAQPTKEASISVDIEIINLSGKRKTSINNFLGNSCTKLITGRPTKLNLTDAGEGYKTQSGTGSVGLQYNYSLFSSYYGVASITASGDSVTKNIGYRPSTDDENPTTIYFYGFSRDLGSVHTYISRESGALINFKAKAILNRMGSIQSIEVIDRGTHFPNSDDSNYQEKFQNLYPVILAFNLSRFPFVYPAATALNSNWASSSTYTALYIPFIAAATGNTLSTVQRTDNIDPAFNYVKRDAIFKVDSEDVIDGKITKFYIKDGGAGFSNFQTIEAGEIFGDVSFVAPTLKLTFNQGSVTKAVIDRTQSIEGYSNKDIAILFKIAGVIPPVTSGAPANNLSDDDTAYFRSIFLDDVPIKDANDRFNYAKFHFDIRVGSVRNGSNGKFPMNIVDSFNKLIEPEFRIPSHTTFIDYPLFGPNNQDQRDYFYTHTIKNPDVSDVSIAIKINKLHYIYEGDEVHLFVNLVPIIGAVIGYMVGTAGAKQIAASVLAPNPTATAGGGGGTAMPCGGPVPVAVATTGATTNIGSAAMQALATAAEMALLLAGGIFGIVLGLLTASIFRCKYAGFLCFRVSTLVKNSGEIWPARLRIGIEYGIEGGSLSEDIIEFRGCATSPYVKDIYLHNLVSPSTDGSLNKKNRVIKIYRYTREMDPVTGGLVEARYQIESDLLSITEYVAGYFSYPNTAIIGTRVNSKDFPSPPKREYLIKGRLLKVPSNYFPDEPKGANKKTELTREQIQNLRYNGAWDGTFKTNLEWSSNPAWIIWDLLTNARYGLGKHGIKESDLDKWSFYEFAQYCDEELEVVIDGITTSERRHMCNLYIDGEQDAYPYIQDLLNLYGGKINYSSGKIYFSSDRPVSSSVMLFNNANVSEEGFAYSSTAQTERITACTVDYLYERDNYILKSEYVEDPAGIREHGYTHIKIAGNGITRKGEAHRLCWRKILTRQLEKEIVHFQTGLQASYLRIGDVVEIMDNNKISNHSGGRITKVIDNRNIELDIPTSILIASPTIYLQISQASDSDYDTSSSDETENRRSAQYAEYTISSASGFQITLSSDIDSTIKKGFSWMIKEKVVTSTGHVETIKPKQYRIKNIKEISQLQFEVIGVEYLDEKYEQIDNSVKTGAEIEAREYSGPVINV